MPGILSLVATGATFMISTFLGSFLTNKILVDMTATFTTYGSPIVGLLTEYGNHLYNNYKDEKQAEILIKKYTKFIDKNINNLINGLDFNNENSIKEYFYYDLLSKEIEQLLLNENIKLKDFFKLNENDIQKLKKINHINYLVIGNSGIGKTTLINSILKLPDEKKGKTESNNLGGITKEITPYNNKKYLPWLTLYDTEGFEKTRDYKLDIEKFNNFIEEKIKNKKYNEFIHGIWYCIDGNRFFEIEIENLIKLHKIYSTKNLNIIVVHTKGKEPKSKEIINKIKDNLENKYNIIDISYICVESMNSEINIDENNKIITHSFGLNELINITKNSISKSFYSIYFKLIQEILEDKFNQEMNNTNNNFKLEYENIESTLLYTLKESLKKILSSESISYINSLNYYNVKKILKNIDEKANKNNNIDNLINQFKNEFSDIRNKKINNDFVNELKNSFKKHNAFKLSQIFEDLLIKIFKNYIFENLDSKINDPQIYEIIENDIQNFKEDL